MDQNKKSVHERYPMCEDQNAQIDCRVTDCIFYKNAGLCSNISPAITLDEEGTFVCWSKATKKNLVEEQQETWLTELNAAIKEIEDEYQVEKDEVDWHNNSMPGVGQTIDYKSYPPEPPALKRLKQLRDYFLNSPKANNVQDQPNPKLK